MGGLHVEQRRAKRQGRLRVASTMAYTDATAMRAWAWVSGSLCSASCRPARGSAGLITQRELGEVATQAHEQQRVARLSRFV